MFCGKCGAQISDQAKFCTKCGNRLESGTRFCTKCEGNHEYCMDHLYTHKHIITDHAGRDPE